MLHRISILFIFFYGFLSPFSSAQNTDCFSHSNVDVFGNNMHVPGVRIGGRIGTLNYQDYGTAYQYNGDTLPTAGLMDAAFWIGGMDTSGIIHTTKDAVFVGYRSYLPGPADSNTNCIDWEKPFKVYKHQIVQHIEDWADNGMIDAPIPEIIAWPGTNNPNFADYYSAALPDVSLAPFVDKNANGIYEPLQGEYPTAEMLDSSIIPEVLIWTIAQDKDLDTFDHRRTEFELQHTVFVLQCSDNESLNNSVFCSMKVVNTSGMRFDSVSVGLYSRMQIGTNSRDAFGTAKDLNSMYVYERNNIDTLLFSNSDPSVFGNNPPASGVTSLSHTLSKSMYFYIGGLCSTSVMFWPSIPPQYYNYLNGYWIDDIPLTNSFSGYNLNGTPTDFIFPDMPWDSLGWNFINNPTPCPEKAYLPSIYLGTILPNESHTFDYCYSFARGDSLNHSENVQLLFENIEGYHDAYSQKFNNACTARMPCVDDCVWPGDTNNDGRVDHLDIVGIILEKGDSDIERSDLPTWKGHTAANWSNKNVWNVNQKYTDANGDGVISELDKVIFKKYFLRENGTWEVKPDSFLFGEELRFFSSGSFDPAHVELGQGFLARFRYTGDSPLGCLAFKLDWDTSKISLEQIYNGNPNLQSESVSFFNVDSTVFHYAGTAVNNDFHIFRLKIKDNLPTPDSTWIRFKNIHAFNSSGNSIEVKGQFLKICIGGGCGFSSTESIRQITPQLFPNPSSDFFQIESSEEVESVRILDALGRLVLEKKKAQQVDIRHLPNGLYFVEMRFESGVFVEKMVKK